MTDMEILPPVQDGEAVSEFWTRTKKSNWRDANGSYRSGIRYFVDVGDALMPHPGFAAV
jgi:hypothetical protein